MATVLKQQSGMSDRLAPLFTPQAVAVIGVSRQKSGLGRRILRALRAAGFPGPIYPITRDGGEVDGLPSRTSIRGLTDVDLAVIAVPRGAVDAAVDDCIAAGVKALVVITAGFAEAGPEGRELQARLVEKVRAAGVRMVGPNCMGLINASRERPLNASFSPVFPPPGGLAMLSQSGALGIVILDLAARRHVGVSQFVSVGNKADVSGNDAIEYWGRDPATRVIALYLESFGNPKHFGRLAREVGRRKPIIAVKSGRTRAGSAAAGSHTAAMAASDVAVSALFHQTGVIRADTIDEMFDIAACLEAQPLPGGSRVAIVTNAGGPGILAADACEAAGLRVVDLEPSTRARLAELLPFVPNAGNPLDMIATAGPAEYEAALAEVLSADEVDALMVLYTPVDPDGAPPIIDAIRAGLTAGRARASRPKPVLACLMADDAHKQLRLADEQIPLYPFPENAARALGKVASYAAWRSAPPGTHRTFDDLEPVTARGICHGVLKARGEDWLLPEEASRVMGCYGLFTTPSIPVRSRDDAASAATIVGLPAVAKLVARQAVHKSDVGGVIVDLRTAGEVAEAFDALQARASAHGLVLDAVQIQPMIEGATETVVGVAHDRLFGSLVGFGSGGVDVELLGDVHFRVSPLTTRDIEELIGESRLVTRLRGYRGRPPGDLDALRDVLARVSKLADDLPEIAELDLNPVLVLDQGRGCQIVDVRIRVRDPQWRPPSRRPEAATTPSAPAPRA